MLEELRALVRRHCTTLAVEAEAVGACLARFTDPDQKESDICAEGIELTHKIKGSSGSIGFQNISEASKRLEHCFRSLSEAEMPLSQTQKDEAVTFYGELEQLIRTISPEDSSLYNASIPTAAH